MPSAGGRGGLRGRGSPLTLRNGIPQTLQLLDAPFADTVRAIADKALPRMPFINALMIQNVINRHLPPSRMCPALPGGSRSASS
jgi:hypothetical protein